jgi:hypothetical protein
MLPQNLLLAKLWQFDSGVATILEFIKSLVQVVVNSLSTKHFDIVGSDAVNKGRDHIATK